MKVLVISHNVLSSYNNMGKTLYSLLGGLKKDEMCQFYIYPSLPDIDCCSSFYKVSDVDVFKSFFKLKVNGKKINKVDNSDDKVFSEKKFKNIYLNRREKKVVEMYLRDFFWKHFNWFNSDLKNWLDEEKPSCIFVAPSKYNFFYKIALKFKEYLNIPIVTYICDDFYFLNHNKMSFFKKLYNKKLQTNIRLLLNNTSHLITISDEMKDMYSKLYSGPISVVMTGVSQNLIKTNDVNNIKRHINSFTFMGNIGFGRYKSLYDIGCALDKYNYNYKKNIRLKIYTPNSDTEKIDLLRQCHSIDLCGYVIGDDYTKVFFNSDVLVHVEGMSSENIDSVKYSISTKIPEVLNSNICFFAYGPSNVSSIKYLKNNNAAIIVDDKDNLYSCIERVITDYDLRKTTILNGKELVKKKHNSIINQNKVNTILYESEKKKKILQVNCVYNNGSTGKIVYDLHSNLKQVGYQSIVCYGRNKKVSEYGIYKLSNEIYCKFNNLLSRITGVPYGGCFLSTYKLIKIIKRERPQVVHLHCLNSYFINIYWLIKWLNINDFNTILTLHAEFMYTANCSYAFSCNQWKTGCKKCPRFRKATKSFVLNNTSFSWNKMYDSFKKFKNITVVSVSPWLMERAKESKILSQFNHKVIFNGLNTNIFKAYDNSFLSNLHKNYDKKIVFHATPFFTDDQENIKGGYYILKLAKMSVNDNIHFIIAGNYDSKITVPSNVTLLGKISDQSLLAKYYSYADLTVITSKIETFSMVVAESLCCGTPVLGFKAGAPEQIALKKYSKFIEYGDINELYLQMKSMLKTKYENIANDAHKIYGRDVMYENYLKLYER